jgi:hypothetical protein
MSSKYLCSITGEKFTLYIVCDSYEQAKACKQVCGLLCFIEVAGPLSSLEFLNNLPHRYGRVRTYCVVPEVINVESIGALIRVASLRADASFISL